MEYEKQKHELESYIHHNFTMYGWLYCLARILFNFRLYNTYVFFFLFFFLTAEIGNGICFIGWLSYTECLIRLPVGNR